MAKSKLVAVNREIEKKVLHGYKKIETGVVGRFKKLSDAFVDQFLTKDGETMEEANKRLAKEAAERKELSK